jgi:hypothetical protein
VTATAVADWFVEAIKPSDLAVGETIGGTLAKVDVVTMADVLQQGRPRRLLVLDFHQVASPFLARLWVSTPGALANANAIGIAAREANAQPEAGGDLWVTVASVYFDPLRAPGGGHAQTRTWTARYVPPALLSSPWLEPK